MRFFTILFGVVRRVIVVPGAGRGNLRFEDFSRGYRLTSTTSIGNILLRNTLPDTFPVFIV